MKKYEIKKHDDYKFTIYLHSSDVEKIQTWLLGQEEVVHSVAAKNIIMVDLTPRCLKEDVENFFKRLEKQLT